VAGGPAGSLHGRVGLVAADGEFDLADAALQANQVLLQLGLLLLDAADLVLQFHIFNLLGREISLQLVLNSVCLDLEGLAHFGGLVAEHVLELLLFLAEHLNFALAKHNVVLNVAGNIFEFSESSLQRAILVGLNLASLHGFVHFKYYFQYSKQLISTPTVDS